MAHMMGYNLGFRVSGLELRVLGEVLELAVSRFLHRWRQQKYARSANNFAGVSHG